MSHRCIASLLADTAAVVETSAPEPSIPMTGVDLVSAMLSLAILGAFVFSLVTWIRLLAVGRRFFGTMALIPARPRPRPFWNVLDFLVFYGFVMVASVLLMGLFQVAGWIPASDTAVAESTLAITADPVPEAVEAEPTDDPVAEATALVSPKITAGQLAVGSLATLLAMLGTVAVLRLRQTDVVARLGGLPTRADVGLGLKASLLILPPTMLMMGLVSVMQEYSHPVLDLLQGEDAVADLTLFGILFVATVVIAPLVEEFWFRGLLQGGLQRLADQPRLNEAVPAVAADGALPASMELTLAEHESNESSGRTAETMDWTPRAVWPMVLASVAFAIAHWGQGLAPIPLFFMAMGLGYLYRQTGSLIPSITVHLVLNGLTMSATFLELLRGSG